MVLTAMGRDNWSDPVKAGPMLNKIPLGRFAEVARGADGSDAASPTVRTGTYSLSLKTSCCSQVDCFLWMCRLGPRGRSRQ